MKRVAHEKSKCRTKIEIEAREKSPGRACVDVKASKHATKRTRWAFKQYPSIHSLAESSGEEKAFLAFPHAAPNRKTLKHPGW